ncbi:MAG: hypothetical protein ACYCXQ_13450 [Candidatus Humimicrobiaceae bacterium]
MDKRFNHENNVTYVVTNVKNYFLHWIVMMNDEWIARSSRAMTVNKIRVKYFPGPRNGSPRISIEVSFSAKSLFENSKELIL